jgi:hypothetical protein
MDRIKKECGMMNKYGFEISNLKKHLIHHFRIHHLSFILFILSIHVNFLFA